VATASFLIHGESWPRAIDLTTLYDSAKAFLDAAAIATQDDDEARRVLSEDLLRCYTGNVVEFHPWQGDFVTEVSDRPAVSELAAYQARSGGHVVNQRHEMVPLDPVARQLISVMDGSRKRDSLIRHLVERVSDGTLTVHQDANPITDPAQIESSLRAVMDQALPKLAKAALLVG